MIFDCVLLALVLILAGIVVMLIEKTNKLQRMIVNAALNVTDLKKAIQEVDEATGADIARLRMQFADFRNDYGDAAIDAEKETARAQKAFADGLNDIMSYGAHLYGRGDNK